MESKKLEKISRVIASIVMILLVGYITYQNIQPFGMEIRYDSAEEKNFFDMAPKTRYDKISVNGIKTISIKDDLVYFSIPMKYHFDKAIVQIDMDNPYPDQEISLGFKDDQAWHFDSTTISAPFLDSLGMNVIGNKPYLFQKGSEFKTVENFLFNLPADKVIGVYDFDNLSSYVHNTTIDGYEPSKTGIEINVPLRGRHVMYAYLRGEPFQMTVVKQDLNWYEDPDVLSINIYKDDSIVYRATVDDDGVTDTSHKTTTSQTIDIKNPGPGLPESGVYKIVFDGGPDVVIKSIKTNLHKIVFDGRIFPIENSRIYGKIITATVPTVVYTNSKIISALTNHKEATQSVILDQKLLPIPGVGEAVEATTSSAVAKIVIPKSDVILKGELGFLSFSPEQFFTPSTSRIVTINDPSDLRFVDYVVSNYNPSKSHTFDLKKAYIEDGRLSWLIRIPGLRAQSRRVVLKNIKVRFIKNSLIPEKWKIL